MNRLLFGAMFGCSTVCFMIAAAIIAIWKNKSERRDERRYGPMRPTDAERLFLMAPVATALPAPRSTWQDRFAVVPAARQWGPQ